MLMTQPIPEVVFNMLHSLKSQENDASQYQTHGTYRQEKHDETQTFEWKINFKSYQDVNILVAVKEICFSL